MIGQALWDAADAVRQAADNVRDAKQLMQCTSPEELAVLTPMVDALLTDLAMFECRLHYVSNHAFQVERETAAKLTDQTS